MKKFKHLQSKGGEAFGFPYYAKNILLLLLLFFVVSIVLMLASSAILFNTSDPASLAMPVGKGILGASSLICGFILSRRVGKLYVPLGAALGLAITLLVFVISLFIPNNNGVSVLWYGMIILATLVGSIIGIKRERKPKHKRRK